MSTEKTVEAMAQEFADADPVHPDDEHAHAFLDSVMAICVREGRKVRSARVMARFIEHEWPKTKFAYTRVITYLRKHHPDTYRKFYERT